MKACIYCDRVVADEVLECPSCSSTAFEKLCPRCGERYDGPACPVCKEADDAARNAAELIQGEEAARQKANSNLGLKALLTFVMPYVGGYFLINKRVRKGYRLFAIIWSLIFELSLLTERVGTIVKIEIIVLSLAPLAVYLIREKAWRWREIDLELKLVTVAFAAALVLSIINVCAFARAGL